MVIGGGTVVTGNAAGEINALKWSKSHFLTWTALVDAGLASVATRTTVRTKATRCAAGTFAAKTCMRVNWVIWAKKTRADPFRDNVNE